MGSFSRQLKAAMSEAHINQTTLAAMAGISKGALSGYLSGKMVPPKKKQERIALALDKPADFFRVLEVDAEIAADEGYRLPVGLAAALMGLDIQTVRIGLQNGDFPFGYAIKIGGSSKFTYWISRIRFSQETGIPVPLKQAGVCSQPDVADVH